MIAKEGFTDSKISTKLGKQLSGNLGRNIPSQGHTACKGLGQRLHAMQKIQPGEWGNIRDDNG